MPAPNLPNRKPDPESARNGRTETFRREKPGQCLSQYRALSFFGRFGSGEDPSDRAGLLHAFSRCPQGQRQHDRRENKKEIISRRKRVSRQSGKLSRNKTPHRHPLNPKGEEDDRLSKRRKTAPSDHEQNHARYDARFQKIRRRTELLQFLKLSDRFHLPGNRFQPHSAERKGQSVP